MRSRSAKSRTPRGDWELPPRDNSSAFDRRRLPLGRGRGVRVYPFSPKGAAMSTNEFKRAGLMALHLLVVLATVAATVIMHLRPACGGHKPAEVARVVS